MKTTDLTTKDPDIEVVYGKHISKKRPREEAFGSLKYLYSHSDHEGGNDMKRKYVGDCTHIMNRKIQKSIRMDSRIYKYIMQQDGQNFSDKFENLVIEHARLTGCERDII